MRLARRVVLCGAVLLLAAGATALPDEEVVAQDDELKGVLDQAAQREEDDIPYATPRPPPSAYLSETFDDPSSFEAVWRRSEAKKDGAEAEVAKYDGIWAVEERAKPLLKGDRSLVMKSQAKHSAIAAGLNRAFKFSAKPLVLQYEVTLQEGQSCGGAYLKLLSLVEGKATLLQDLTDKTPYTIMFGPDNCGNDYKVHFIFRHVSPITGKVEEKHAKKPSGNLDQYFKDKKPHLYRLVVRPDNTFEISIDHISISSGSLLEDMEPPVNPPKEIADPKAEKPGDWDERETIADPDDKKPDDWDESQPIRIQDESAVKPSGWLEEEPPMIPNPEATKPDDWDEDMDGAWEAPLLDNPACAAAEGCGPWTAPTVANPQHRGKWMPRQVPNPAYQGVWAPRMIPNPDHFEDLEPFKMTPITAVGLELWTITADVLFDDILLTDSLQEADAFAADTFDLKTARLNRDENNVLQQVLAYSNAHPWLYAVYVLVAAIPVIIVVMCCCSPKEDAVPDRKKTDEPTPDVEEQEEVKEAEAETKQAEAETKEAEAETKEAEAETKQETELEAPVEAVAAGGSQSEGEDSQVEEAGCSQAEDEEVVGPRTRARRRVRKE